MFLILIFDSLPIETKLKILSEIIGKTHGIRLRINPPINAKINACINVICKDSELLSFDLTCNVANCWFQLSEYCWFQFHLKSNNDHY